MDPLAAWRLARRLRLRDLHALLVVLDSGSMAKAAGRLGLTQPAVSKAMQEMETTLGVPLLERDPRGVRATPFGEAIALRARAMIDELELGARDIAHLADPAQGEVRVGTTEPMMVLIADAVHALARRHPRITFDITISDTGSLLRTLRDRRLDVVVTRHGEGGVEDDLEKQWLFRVPLVVVADRRNPLLRRRVTGLAALSEEAWTLSPPDTYLGRAVETVFRAQGLALPRSAATSVSIAMRLSLIEGGRFITMLPRTILHHPQNRPWLRAFDLDLPASAGAIAALTLKRRFSPGRVRLFLDALRDAVPGMAGTDPVGA